MKALVKSKAERGLWLEDVPEPTIGINDVLVQVHYTGICGTDVHIHQWDEWAQKTIPVPMTIGHEFVGKIVATGSNVNDFFPGDIVSGEGHVVCGRCRNCLAGRRHLCDSTLGVGVNRPGAIHAYSQGRSTKMPPSRKTIAAPAANDVTLAADDIAGKEVVNIRAGSDNFSYKLVTDGHGNRDGLLRPLVPLMNVDIGPTDARVVHLHQHIVDADRRLGDVFQPKTPLGFALYQCFHRLFVSSLIWTVF